jgi:hypothetical protein
MQHIKNVLFTFIVVLRPLNNRVSTWSFEYFERATCTIVKVGRFSNVMALVTEGKLCFTSTFSTSESVAASPKLMVIDATTDPGDKEACRKAKGEAE